MIVSDGGGAVHERPGDLLYGAEVVAVAPVRLEPRDPAGAFPVARIGVRWRDARGVEHRQEENVTVAVVPEAQAQIAEDPEVVRARDERLLRAAQEEAEHLARLGEFEEAVDLLARTAALLATPALAKFVINELVPSYRDRAGYVSRSGTRSSTLSALKRRKQLIPTEEVEEEFTHTTSTPGELSMERSFRRRRR
jgi:hypothetical protein